MRKLLSVFFLTLLVACTSTTSGARKDQLRKKDYLRTERNMEILFPEIQMALFKHERICGNAPVFKMKENSTSSATITEANVDEQPWNQIILFDLTWLQPSMWKEERTRVEVYSFFSNADIKNRINKIFEAIYNPEEC